MQVLVDFRSFPVSEIGLHAEYDPPVLAIEFDDLKRDLLAFLEGVARPFDFRMVELGNGYESLHFMRQFNDHAPFEQTYDDPRRLGVDRVDLGERKPRIFRYLLDAQGYPPRLGVDVEDHDVDLFTLLDDFARVLDTPCPGHVGNMDQSVDALFDLHEGSESGDISHATLHHGTHGVPLVQRQPRIGLSLLHTERYLLVLLVHLEHGRIHVLVDRDHLRRMGHVLRPGHFGDVNQTFDTTLQFDERPVIGDADDPARDP